MLSHYVALVRETKKIGMAELSAVAAAVQKQVTRDFAPVWGVQACVAAFDGLEEMPLDYWPVVVTDVLEKPGALGYHDDPHGQPCAHVMLTADWTATVSHETLEMLVDPFGRRLVAGPSPDGKRKRVRYLVEVCDPCPDITYKVNGIEMSDFYTPRFFDPVRATGVRYSHMGAIRKPRQLLKGGYMTWHDYEEDQWWHYNWFDTENPPVNDQVPIPNLIQQNLRAVIDEHAAKLRRDRKAAHDAKPWQPPPGPGRAHRNRAHAIRNALKLR